MEESICTRVVSWMKAFTSAEAFIQKGPVCTDGKGNYSNKQTPHSIR